AVGGRGQAARRGGWGSARAGATAGAGDRHQRRRHLAEAVSERPDPSLREPDPSLRPPDPGLRPPDPAGTRPKVDPQSLDLGRATFLPAPTALPPGAAPVELEPTAT